MAVRWRLPVPPGVFIWVIGGCTRTRTLDPLSKSNVPTINMAQRSSINHPCCHSLSYVLLDLSTTRPYIPQHGDTPLIPVILCPQRVPNIQGHSLTFDQRVQ